MSHPVPSDYDSDPGRSRAFIVPPTSDVHVAVAARILVDGLAPVVDVGCGTGRLAQVLAAEACWIGIDLSRTQVVGAPRGAVIGDATRLPLASGSAGAVCALWMLYHLPDPTAAIKEAWRVLQPGGLFASCAARRDDSPELLPPSEPTTFDAEDAPVMVSSIFGNVEVETWDAQLLTLSDRDEVRRYLVSRLADPSLADHVETPLTVTKRGSLVWARKR